MSCNLILFHAAHVARSSPENETQIFAPWRLCVTPPGLIISRKGAVTKIYPLRETAAADNYLETGHVRGKLVITID